MSLEYELPEATWTVSPAPGPWWVLHTQLVRTVNWHLVCRSLGRK